MTDRKTGETTFTLRGTVYRLKLDSDAMVAMEEAASTPDRRVFFHQIMALAQAGSWTHQRILVWASLRLHHGEITLKQAGDLMLDSATEELNRSMSDLAVEATPDPADLEALGVAPSKDPPAPPTRRAKTSAGTGTRSTDTAAASA